jgi:hypothetical protein
MSTKARKWWLAAVLVIAWCAIVATCLRDREPRYEGKRLSYWITQLTLDPPYDPPMPAAQVAVRAIGTNALPYLLRNLRSKDSRLTKLLLAIDEKQTVVNLHVKPAAKRCEEVWRAFMALSDIAEPAVPDLVRKVRGDDELASGVAIEVLPHLGAKGIAAAISLFSSTNAAIRKDAALSLSGWLLGGTNELRYQIYARQYRLRASTAIPALTNLLRDPNDWVAHAATLSLRVIHQRPDVVVPALTNLLADSRAAERARSGAARALGYFGQESKAAVPLLEQLAHSNQEKLARSAKVALNQIIAAPNASVGEGKTPDMER